MKVKIRKNEIKKEKIKVKKERMLLRHSNIANVNLMNFEQKYEREGEREKNNICKQNNKFSPGVNMCQNYFFCNGSLANYTATIFR